MSDRQNQIIIVTGSGRCGTSLTTELLHKAGMRVSPDLIGASFGNPSGHWEDGEIVEVHQKLLQSIDYKPHLPMPKNWLHEAASRSAEKQLASIVEERIGESDTIWGFKDPRVASLMPLWLKLFNKLKLNPRIVLCVRHPNAVVRSFELHYGRNAQDSSLTWLLRNLDIIRATNASFFVAHYEDWGSMNASLLDELLAYCSLSPSDGTTDTKQIVHENFSDDFDHSMRVDKEIQNSVLNRMYAALRACSGGNFDRSGLVATSNEIEQDMQIYTRWAGELARVDAHHQNYQSLEGGLSLLTAVMKLSIESAPHDVKIRKLNRLSEKANEDLRPLIAKFIEKEKAQFKLQRQITKIQRQVDLNFKDTKLLQRKFSFSDEKFKNLDSSFAAKLQELQEFVDGKFEELSKRMTKPEGRDTSNGTVKKPVKKDSPRQTEN